MIVYFPIFKIYVTLCLIGLFKKSIIQLKPTRQYPVPVVTSCVITAEPVKYRAMRTMYRPQSNADKSMKYDQDNIGSHYSIVRHFLSISIGVHTCI